MDSAVKGRVGIVVDDAVQQVGAIAIQRRGTIWRRFHPIGGLGHPKDDDPAAMIRQRQSCLGKIGLGLFIGLQVEPVLDLDVEALAGLAEDIGQTVSDIVIDHWE